MPRPWPVKIENEGDRVTDAMRLEERLAIKDMVRDLGVSPELVEVIADAYDPASIVTFGAAGQGFGRWRVSQAAMFAVVLGLDIASDPGASGLGDEARCRRLLRRLAGGEPVPGVVFRDVPAFQEMAAEILAVMGEG